MAECSLDLIIFTHSPENSLEYVTTVNNENDSVVSDWVDDDVVSDWVDDDIVSDCDGVVDDNGVNKVLSIVKDYIHNAVVLYSTIY